ncbi:MAG: peptidase M14 [Gemmatimonadetes bacterium]|nr:peptidase M14 [Gemmatimonadota bacterium]
MTRGFPGALALALLVLAAVRAPAQQVPHPKDVFGFEPGADHELATYDQMLQYYDRLDAASDRVQKIEIGTSTHGRPQLLLLISSEDNLRQLDRWRSISERLARARMSDDEARRLAGEGRAIVWIDGGMHATERAHGQMTSLLAYRVVTEESEEMRNIRENVVLLLVPVINPDGLDRVTSWYQKVRGTPFACTSPPVLYQEYVGHDNNRDWYMILQRETRNVARVLYHEWYPQIVYNHHQTSPAWTRIFHPPFFDPVNPSIPAGVIKGTNLVGEAMGKRFVDLNMPGAISRSGFDMWWNGGMRTAPYYHNMVGILTETGHACPVPQYWDPKAMPANVGGARGGAPTDRPTLYYPLPWQGGWARFRDAVNYMIEGSIAVLDIGAERREEWLYNIYRMGRESIVAGEAGKPFAWVIAPDQWDPGEAVELVNVLRRGGVEVQRATSEFRAGGRSFPAGSYIAYAAQPYRPHVVDLMEPQKYPDARQYPGGPPIPPYDMAGWTLPIQMGVNVVRVDEPFQAETAAVEMASAEGRVTGDARFGYLLSHRVNAGFRAVNRLLKAGERVSWAGSAFRVGGQEHEAGTIVVESRRGTRERAEGLARELGLEFVGVASRPEAELYPLRVPRIGLYKSWQSNMDEGWTRWILENHEFPFDTLHDREMRTADLSRYDAIIIPDQSRDGILHGHLPGTMPDEYVGGIGLEGAGRLEEYVRNGGTVVTLDAASDFAIEQFGLPLRNVVTGLREEEFYIPGSLIAMEVDATHPYAYGMPENAAAFFVDSRAFDVRESASAGDWKAEEPPVEVLARYRDRDLLLSGWALGAERYLGRRIAAARVRHGAGDVVLLGFRSQFRGQPRGTFKLLLNALHASTLPRLPGRAGVTAAASGGTR